MFRRFAAPAGSFAHAGGAALAAALILAVPAAAQKNTFIMAMTTTPKGFDSDI